MSKGSHMVRWHNDTIPRWRHESYGRQQGATHGTRQDAAHDTRHFGSSTTGSRVAADQPFPAGHLASNKVSTWELRMGVMAFYALLSSSNCETNTNWIHVVFSFNALIITSVNSCSLSIYTCHQKMGSRQIGPLADLAANWAPHDVLFYNSN